MREFFASETFSWTGYTRTTVSAAVVWSATSNKTTATTAIEPPHGSSSIRVET
ncbi:hypothetical protein DPMN_074489 [Dreissena polymorpha]|uniref:Uncharacterized protein n=1 Tax=Dreissena polymorpha TaxID=45954 RepID=A0A9D3YF32_DREPO|nr:hypothetical protein DPMN_074489 [Dreissena polymorpha]